MPYILLAQDMHILPALGTELDNIALIVILLELAKNWKIKGLNDYFSCMIMIY